MFEYNGKQIETDSEGYLLNSNDWEEGMIEILAQDEAIELTDAHLEVVHFVRSFYEEFNTSPAVRMLVKAMEKAHGPEKGPHSAAQQEQGERDQYVQDRHGLFEPTQT